MGKRTPYFKFLSFPQEMLSCVCGWMIVSACLVSASSLFADEENQPQLVQAEQHLHHAETWHWLGMAENGNMRAFARGKGEIAAGLAVLEKLKASPDPKNLQLRLRLEGLGRDIEEQAELTHDTLYGVFPVVRLLGPSLLLQPSGTGTFEMFDDPAVVAATRAAASLSDSLSTLAAREGQLPVVFSTIPKSKALENEVRYVFNQNPNFFVSPESDITGIINQDAQIGQDDMATVANHLGTGKLLLVSIEETDVIPGNLHFYSLRAKFHGLPAQKNSESVAFGFCRDSRDSLGAIILWHGALAALALLAFGGFRYLRESGWPLDVGGATVALGTFILGRLLCYPIIHLLRTVMPPPETLAITSAWWPVAVGIAVLSAPWLVIRISSTRIRLPLIVTANWDGVAVAGTLGAVSFFVAPSILWCEGRSAGLLLPFTVGAGLTGWFAGQVLLGRYREIMLLLPVTLSGIVCSSFLTGQAALTTGALACSVGVLIPLAILRERSAQRRGKTEAISANEEKGGIAYSPDGKRAIKPVFQPPNDFERMRTKCLTPDEKGSKTVWLALVGPPGSGKTACCHELLRIMIAGLGKCVVLRGDCGSEPGHSASPYTPFRQALADVFDVANFSGKGGREGICDALGPIMDVIPFMNLIPVSTVEEDQPSTQEEVFKAVLRILRKKAENSRLVVWMGSWENRDPLSSQLCSYLHEHLPTGGNANILFLLEGRCREAIRTDGLADDEIVDVPPPDLNHLQSILVRGLRFEPTSAATIAEFVQIAPEGRGGVFWLMEIVKHLWKHEALVEHDGVWQLADRYSGGAEALPLPEDLGDLVREQVDDLDRHRPLLECAACLGTEFTATVLANALRWDRLEVLRALNDIESSSGLLHDMRDQDDVFTFSSELLLDQIRRVFSISFCGPRDHSVPQVIRELHARVGEALANAVSDHPAYVFAAARHYHAAGKSHAALGVKWCQEASRASNAIFDWEGAMTCLKMARESSEAGKLGLSFQWDELTIGLERGHVTGSGNEQAAKDGLEYWEEDDLPPDIRLKILRACYDAGRTDPGFLKKVTQLAGDARIKELDGPIHRAEAKQFEALAMVKTNAMKAIGVLREALSLAENAPDSTKGRALLARICDSLANQLLWGSSPEQPPTIEIIELYRRSIAEKSTMKPVDLPGLARSHGGMARALLRGPNPDFEGVRQHACENRSISVKIGDEIGISMMESMLGKCDLLQAIRSEKGPESERFALAALDHYLKAWESASGHEINTAYAACGILQSGASAGYPESTNSAREYLQQALTEKGRIRDFLVSELGLESSKWPDNPRCPAWVKELAQNFQNLLP